MQIYVGNLSYDATEEALEQAFSQYGDVKSVNIVKDRETGRSRGFGFIEMSDSQAGQQAIEGLNLHVPVRNVEVEAEDDDDIDESRAGTHG